MRWSQTHSSGKINGLLSGYKQAVFSQINWHEDSNYIFTRKKVVLFCVIQHCKLSEWVIQFQWALTAKLINWKVCDGCTSGRNNTEMISSIKYHRVHIVGNFHCMVNWNLPNISLQTLYTILTRHYAPFVYKPPLTICMNLMRRYNLRTVPPHIWSLVTYWPAIHRCIAFSDRSHSAPSLIISWSFA